MKPEELLTRARAQGWAIVLEDDGKVFIDVQDDLEPDAELLDLLREQRHAIYNYLVYQNLPPAISTNFEYVPGTHVRAPAGTWLNDTRRLYDQAAIDAERRRREGALPPHRRHAHERGEESARRVTRETYNKVKRMYDQGQAQLAAPDTTPSVRARIVAQAPKFKETMDAYEGQAQLAAREPSEQELRYRAWIAEHKGNAGA